MSRIIEEIDNMSLYYRDLIDQWVNEHRDEILDFNRSLISIPSENLYPTGNEKEVQNYVANKLDELGCNVDVFLPTDVEGIHDHPAFLKGREYKDRPNVVGIKKGSGGGRSIIFSGHMDTVPIGIDPWSVDPFSGVIKEGKQYGLGLFDMKGGMAAAMLALRSLNELGILLKGDVIIENVVDEEFGGANGTLACRLKGYEADIAIIPEPSNMSICPENQGGSMFRITFKGRPGRSFSGEELVNPVYATAKFVEIFHEFEEYQAKKIPNSKYFKENAFLPAYIQGMKAGQTLLPLYDRIPSESTVDVWIQCYPGTTEEELKNDFITFINKKMENDDIFKKTPPKIEKLIRFLPASGIPENHDILNVVKNVSNSFGEQLPIEGAPFACDSFMFNIHSNTPALIWGPKGGNAHAPDEFIYIEEFMKLVKMFALTIVQWCGVNR